MKAAVLIVLSALAFASCAPRVAVVPERTAPKSDNSLWEYPDWR